MEQKAHTVIDVLSQSDAALLGAFPEDALSEVDAAASVNDEHETPNAALGTAKE